MQVSANITVRFEPRIAFSCPWLRLPDVGWLRNGRAETKTGVAAPSTPSPGVSTAFKPEAGHGLIFAIHEAAMSWAWDRNRRSLVMT